MARISGVDLPREKRVEIGLTYIYGIGVASSRRILAEANVDPDFVTERDFRFVDRRRRRMQEPVKVRNVL